MRGVVQAIFRNLKKSFNGTPTCPTYLYAASIFRLSERRRSMYGK